MVHKGLYINNNLIESIDRSKNCDTHVEFTSLNLSNGRSVVIITSDDEHKAIVSQVGGFYHRAKKETVEAWRYCDKPTFEMMAEWYQKDKIKQGTRVVISRFGGKIKILTIVVFDVHLDFFSGVEDTQSGTVYVYGEISRLDYFEILNHDVVAIDKKQLAIAKVLFAALTNNAGGKLEDISGRTYREVFKKFGLAQMVEEYLKTNRWGIK
jgi:hypothetical protein